MSAVLRKLGIGSYRVSGFFANDLSQRFSADVGARFALRGQSDIRNNSTFAYRPYETEVFIVNKAVLVLDRSNLDFLFIVIGNGSVNAVHGRFPHSYERAVAVKLFVSYLVDGLLDYSVCNA